MRAFIGLQNKYYCLHMLGLGSEDPDQYTLALLRKLTHLPYMMAKKNIKWNFKWLAFIIHVFKLVDNSQISLQKKISILGTFIQSPCPLLIEGLSYMQDLLPVLIDSDSNRRMPDIEQQAGLIVITEMLMAGVITPLQAYQLQEKKTISNNGTLIAIILIINCEHYTVSQDITNVNIKLYYKVQKIYTKCMMLKCKSDAALTTCCKLYM